MHADDKQNAPGVAWVQDLWAVLLWPRLLRVPALAARPQRVLLSLFLLVLVGAIGGIKVPGRADQPAFLDAILAAKLEPLGGLIDAVLHADVSAAAVAFGALLTNPTRLAATEYPLECFLLGIPILLVIAVMAGAVCRSVACEFSQELTLPWTRQLAFALARWRSLVGVLVLPWAIIGVIALVLAAAGFVLFNGIPGLEILGAILFGLGALLGLAAVALLVLGTLAWPTLIPAVACEGTDAIDAVGRALAYAIARPLRLLVYLVIAGTVCAIAAGIAMAIAEGAARFAEAATTAWTTNQGFAEVRGEWAIPQYDDAGEPLPVSGMAATSAWIVAFWGGCLRVLAAAYAVSMGLTAGTLVYLFMRQICDGQHYAELWTPGRIERSFEAAMSQPIADHGDEELDPSE